MASPLDTLRESIKTRRDRLSPDECTAWAKTINASCLSLPAYQESHRIGVYIAYRQEVDTTGIIEQAWKDNKQVYLPVLAEDAHHLYFVEYTIDSVLEKNRYGIYEPRYLPEQMLQSDQLDLVITPLVAFDKDCHRIGMGAGFYDRTFYFLNQNPRPVKPILLGLAYDFQREDQLNRQPWDVNLNYIITQSQTYSLHGRIE